LPAASLALVGAAHAADIVGAASAGGTDAELYVAVGESQVNGSPHRAGKAGIGVGTVSQAKPVDFQGLSAYSAPTTVNGVTVRTLAMPITGAPGSHAGMGHFNFVKVGSGDVWFGEWSRMAPPVASTTARSTSLATAPAPRCPPAWPPTRWPA
jgi:hypothetical protein